MTTYTFIGNPNMQSVVWNDSTVWSSGDPLNPFPNSPTADVVIPEITKSDGSVYTSFITIQHLASYAANSVSITDNDLLVDGTLSVTNAVDVKGGGEINLQGGTLSAGSLTVESAVEPGNGQVQGAGHINVTTLTNDAAIVGEGGDLSISAHALDNIGTLTASSGTFTVTVDSGGFSNLSGSTLTGGSYVAIGAPGGSILDLNVGAVITTDAANIQFSGGGDIQSFDPGSSSYVSLQTSLTTIAQGGTLTLNNQTFNSNGLTDDGVLNLSESGSGTTTFNAPHLTIGSQGSVNGVGTIAAPISNSGIIIAGFMPGGAVISITPQPENNLLEITGPVSGTGVLEVGAPYAIISGGTTKESFQFATLQLDGPDSENVVFAESTIPPNSPSNGESTLLLNDLGGFTGAIEPGSNGDNIILPNMTFSSVTGYSYAGNSSAGTLTIHEGASTIKLNFIGDLDTADFTLAAGPQPISSSPSSLEITVNPDPSPSFPSPPNPAAPAGTSAVMVLNNPTNGQYEVYDIGHNSALAAYLLGTIGTPWHAQAVGNFSGTDSTDLAVRNDNGQFQYYDVANNNVTQSGVMGAVGTDWSVVGTGRFDSSNFTDMMMRQANGASFTYDAFIVRNNQFAAANPIAIVGSEWQTMGFGDVNGDGTADMVLRNPANGALEYYDLVNGQLTSAGVLGVLNTAWQPVGFGNFDNSGFSDLIMRNSNNGEYDLFEIRNNQIVNAHEVAALGAGWQLAGFGDVNGDGTDDMVLQNTNTGVFEYYDFVNGQVTAAGELAQVGTDWTVTGITPATGTALSAPATALASDPAPSSGDASRFMASDPGPASFRASDPGPSSFMASDPGPFSFMTSDPGPSSFMAQDPGPSLFMTSDPGPQNLAADTSLFADPSAGTMPLAYFGMPNPLQAHS